MGIKDKLFGGPQNPQQPKIAEEIVNPYYNISQDGTASSSASFVPSAAPNPFMQFQQQQNQPPMQQPPMQQQAPVMNNDDRFDIAQPDTPNGYYAPTSAAPEAPAAEGWTCDCGQTGITGKFCFNCGKAKPEPVSAPVEAPTEGWTCECGQTGNTFKFCINCGKAKPEPAAAPAEEVTTPVAAPAENAAPAEAPAEGWTCECGQTGNTFKFCINCGKAKPEPAAAPAEEVTTPVAAPAENTAPAEAPAEGWTCACGQSGNKYQFCINCGASRPEPAAVPSPAPQAPAPQQTAGVWACECGFTGNTGEYCLNCGSHKPY